MYLCYLWYPKILFDQDLLQTLIRALFALLQFSEWNIKKYILKDDFYFILIYYIKIFYKLKP